MHALRRLSPAFTMLLLAAAMLLRVVVPSGWMPVADEGGVRVEICRGNATAVLILDADGQYHEQAPESPRDPCPFGLAGGAALPPVAVMLADAPLALEPATYPPLAAPQLRAPRLILPPATGPPVFA